MKLDHVSIIVSSLEGIEFYKKLGFKIVSEENRGYDDLFYLSNDEITLEIYVDNKHPKRITKPEALGLRHIAFKVNDIEKFAKEWNVELKKDKTGLFCFINDPDNLPIEIRSY